MLCGRYTFYCIFQDEAVFPEYKGSTFRGLFGHALKKIACALKKESCRDCLLQEKCVYAFVFETPSLPSVSEKVRVSSPPHPYVFDFPHDSKTHYQPGEVFAFSLLLFGKANDYLPYFIYAFTEIGASGIGRRVNGRRSRFCLQRVQTERSLVYTRDDDKMRNGRYAQELTIANVNAEKAASVETVEVSLVTPLRLKYRNTLEASLPFHILVRAMLRRASTLFNYHGQGEPPLDYRGLVERAGRIETVASSLRWFDWKRYSNRQEQSMLMGGMTGKITYNGDLTEYMPLLEFGEKVHLGKQTTFGLGKIEVKPLSINGRGVG